MQMRNVLRLIVFSVGVWAAGATAAQAQTYTLTATLDGSEESPGINTGAFGSATITVDLGARTVSYRVDVFNLPSGVTASHIHVGAVGTTGPIIVNFAPPLTASNDFSYAGTVPEAQFLMRAEQGIRSADDVFQAILGGNTYVNVHSAVNPAGEIRGRLVLKQQ
jgi:hypothetical protein